LEGGTTLSSQFLSDDGDDGEVMMQRDAPYLDLSKHDEDHPYYNVPPEASGD